MKKALGLLALLALLSTAAHAECIRPSKPATLPDGNTATRDEMVAANKLVKQYNADMYAYTKCIQTEREAAIARDLNVSGVTQEAGRARTAQHRAEIFNSCSQTCDEINVAWKRKNNAAIDEWEIVVNQFNEQLRIFKSRNAQ